MDISMKSVATMIDELITTDIKCFFAQEEITKGTSTEAVAGAAKKAQELNARRNALIRAIDVSLGQGGISVTGKTYGP
jgi:hypothetical protein